jgi:acetyl-CoA carboxylase carboxyltransferase component
MASGVVPQICAIMGHRRAVRLFPALMDFNYMVKKDYAQMFITGPQVVKATNRRGSDVYRSGGAQQQTPRAAWPISWPKATKIALPRSSSSVLSASNHQEKPRILPCDDPADRREEKLAEIVPDRATALTNAQAIKLVVDHGEIYESQRLFAQT